MLGSNGHFVVVATPPTLTTNQVGEPFDDSGLNVSVTDNDPLPNDIGDPVTSRYVPYTLSTSPGALNYTADSGVNHLSLTYNPTTGNLDLGDNGLIVFTQPLAETNSVVINSAPDATNALTINLGTSVPAGFTIPSVDFFGGAGNTNTLLIAGNISGRASQKLVVTSDGPEAGAIALASKKTGTALVVTYFDVSAVQSDANAHKVVVSIPTRGPRDREQKGHTVTLVSPTQSFVRTTFTKPSTLNIVRPHAAR